MATDEAFESTSHNGTCIEYNDELRQSGELTTYLATQIIFGILYSVIFVAGVTGNSFVILSVARNQALQSVRNLFIVSLSCSDIFVCFMSGTVTPITNFAKNWLFGRFLCYALPLVQGMSICISTFTLTCIAIDRYILIIYPTKPAISRMQSIIMIASIWVLAAGVAIPSVIHQDIITYTRFCGTFCMENNWATNNGRMIYGIAVLVVQFVIPLIIIGFCYIRICLRLGQGMLLRGTQGNSENLSERQKIAVRRKQRTNRMLIGMVVIFACCWFPSVLLNVTRDLALDDLIPNQANFLSVITHCLAMTTTVWNPVLYAWLNEQFRQAFVDIMPCIKKRLRNTEAHTRLRTNSDEETNTRKNTLIQINSTTTSSTRPTVLTVPTTVLNGKEENGGVANHKGKEDELKMDGDGTEGDTLL